MASKDCLFVDGNLSVEWDGRFVEVYMDSGEPYMVGNASYLDPAEARKMALWILERVDLL